MQFPWLLLLAALSRTKAADNATNGVPVHEFNYDIDYRDFNETVDLATEADRKPSTHGVNETIGNDDKNHSDTSMVLSPEHDVFPKNISTYGLRQPCSGHCSPGEISRWLNSTEFWKIFMLLSVAAMTIGCLVILHVVKLKRTQARSWDYSPTLMEDGGYRLKVFQTNIH